MRLPSRVLSTLLYGIAAVNALNPIVFKGHKMFDSVTGEQFFIKGVAYQPRGEVSKDASIPDPLADPVACARDAVLMKKLGLNVVRVYEVDPSKNHDACMKSFADAGIYLLLDIATPKFSVNRKTPEYDTRLYSAFRKTIDAFADYDNTFAFIAGNEVTNDKTNTPASAYVKAIIRDVKKYIKVTKRRYIPVGYASNDDEHIRDAIKDYFACGDEDVQVDFFGVNMYEWCGGSSFEKSGYADRTKEFEHYHKPVFLSEFGCNLVSPREFSEVTAIYSDKMTSVWSGGVVYEWTQENNNYGLVKVDPNGGEAKLLDDYHHLQKALANTKPKGVTMDVFTEQRPSAACPKQTDNWKASVILPPTPSEGACECMRQSVSCGASDKVMNSGPKGGNNSLGSQLDTLCGGLVPCDDISGDAEKGRYGYFSFCSPSDKLSWLYNLYMQKHPDGKCDFDGNAKVMTPQGKDASACASVVDKLQGPPPLQEDSDSKSTARSKSSSTDLHPGMLTLALGVAFCARVVW